MALYRRLDKPATRTAPEVSLDAIAFARYHFNFIADPQQQRVLKPNATRGILNCTRQWGKSTVIAIKAVHHAVTRPNALVIVCSPSLRQSQEFCRKVSGYLRKLGLKSLNLPNGSRIVGLPANENTIRGFSAATLLLIDEAARVSDDLYAAAKPMLATTNGEMWLMSTPRGPRGFFHREWMDAAATWERVSVTAADCPRIIPEFLADERRSLGEHKFRQEYCCEFLDDGQSAFPTKWIDQAFQPFPRAREWRIGASFAIGVDIGQQNNPSAIVVLERWVQQTDQIDRTTFERAKTTHYAVRAIERVPLGTSYVDVVARVADHARYWKTLGDSYTVLDATGVGAAILDMLRNEVFHHARVVPVIFTAGGRETFHIDRYHVPKRELIQTLGLILENGALQIDPSLPDSEALRRELQNLRWQSTHSGNETLTGGTKHDDLVMALALGTWWIRRH